MPRVARIVAPRGPHHVVQRGSNRRDVFFTDEDRRPYLAILAEQARRRSDPAALLDPTEWGRVFKPDGWREYLRAALSEDDREMLDRLRGHTRRDRPLGSDAFLAKLETAMNRRLRAAPVGRPREGKKIGDCP